jgi:hypothetical protein
MRRWQARWNIERECKCNAGEVTRMSVRVECGLRSKISRPRGWHCFMNMAIQEEDCELTMQNYHSEAINPVLVRSCSLYFCFFHVGFSIY